MGRAGEHRHVFAAAQPAVALIVSARRSERLMGLPAFFAPAPRRWAPAIIAGNPTSMTARGRGLHNSYKGCSGETAIKEGRSVTLRAAPGVRTRGARARAAR